MKPARTAAMVITAIALPTLAACSGGSPGSSAAGGATSSAPAQSRSQPAQSRAASQSPAAATGASGLTPPGTHLGFGQEAIVGWVPPSQDTGNGAHQGLKLQVTVESIQKGTLADFADVDLDAKQKKSTPYYVEVRLTALGNTNPPKDNDPALTFTAIDDRGQQQDNITFLGTFQRCDDPSPPASFVDGKSYTSCLAYLIPGGGSIKAVQWDDGPSPADDVSPYFDKPIVWGN